MGSRVFVAFASRREYRRVSGRGDSVEQVLAEFPDLERDDILASLEFSRKMLAAESVHLALIVHP